MSSLSKFFHVLVIFLIGNLCGGEYKIEGVYLLDGWLGDFYTTFYLPNNPTILAISKRPDINPEWRRWRPDPILIRADTILSGKKFKCDLLWIDREGDELEMLKNGAESLKSVSVIYTSTHFFHDDRSYQHLKNYLESAGFTLFIHWYWEGDEGNALFVRKDLFDAGMRTLSYTPHPYNLPIISQSPDRLERFFKPALNKSGQHHMKGIDYIYMINLDERPEKFAQASAELGKYGIYPYRFSAVNGWKLPTATLNQIGLKLFAQLGDDKFMGTVFKEINGREYMSHEFIEKTGENYFVLGLTRGAIGCILSHLSILQDAYDSGYETIWILEDDVEPVEDPNQISSLLVKLDQMVEWDILFTDTDTKDTSGLHVPCRSLAARLNVLEPQLNAFLERFYPISDDFSRVGMRFGTYSMIIRRSGMEKILNYYKTYGIFLPYDLDYWLTPNIKMYKFNRDIVSHRANSASDNGEPNYLKRKE